MKLLVWYKGKQHIYYDGNGGWAKIHYNATDKEDVELNDRDKTLINTKRKSLILVYEYKLKFLGTNKTPTFQEKNALIKAIKDIQDFSYNGMVWRGDVLI